MRNYEPNMNSLNKRIKLLNLEITAPFHQQAPELKAELEQLVAQRNAILNGVRVFEKVEVK